MIANSKDSDHDYPQCFKEEVAYTHLRKAHSQLNDGTYSGSEILKSKTRRLYCGSYMVLETAIYRYIYVHYALNLYDDDDMQGFFESKCHSVCFLCSDPSNLTARKLHIKILPGSLGDR